MMYVRIKCYSYFIFFYFHSFFLIELCISCEWYVDWLFGFTTDETIRILASVMVISILQYMLIAWCHCITCPNQILLDKMHCKVEQGGSNTLSAKKLSLPNLLCPFSFNWILWSVKQMVWYSLKYESIEVVDWYLVTPTAL